jgi:hypothetical protein
MSKSIKLYNKGKRSIQYAKDKAIKPNGNVYLSKDEADKLISLYPLELVDFSKFVNSNEDEKALKAELKAAQSKIEKLEKALAEANKTTKNVNSLA